jgi:hypothetical protein
MALMLVCVLLALVGVAAIAAWGTLGIEAPAAEAGGGRAASAVRRYLWWANLVISGGLVTGICAAGAGGRLVMRLLAATSPDARGAVTEADQTVGEITVGGTLGFLLFAALPLAILASVAFAFSYRWLPRGRLAGLLYGLLLLVVLGSRFEPLRSNNPDFRLLEPAWLAVVAFALLVLADGMLTAAFMGWYSRRLPLPAGHRGVLLYYLWPVPLVLILFVVLVPVVVLTAIGAGLVAIVARFAPSLGQWWTSKRTTWVGRGLLAGGSVAALPGFVGAVNAIIP